MANALQQNEVNLISYLPAHFLVFFSQTLTTLDLGYNRISARGARLLADALHQNKVTLLMYFLLYCTMQTLLCIDTHHSDSF